MWVKAPVAASNDLPKSKSATSSLADALKAMGHPVRLEIIRQLTIRDRCCAGDFCNCLPLAQSTISQHLELLKQTGIIDWQQQGTRSIYSLNKSRLAELSNHLANLAGNGLSSASRKL